MVIIIKILKLILNIIYSLFKLFKTKNRITFISRQSNNINVDFVLLGKEINKEIEANAKAYNYEYIDMYDELTDFDGNLNLEYTIDGLHLSPEGYKVVTAKRMKYITQPSK